MQASDDKDRAPLVIAILAAGASSRMRGGDKLGETLEGVPLLRVIARRALLTGLPCIVTLPESGPRSAMLDGLDVVRLSVGDADEGMAASFRALGRAAAGSAVMVVLADMPEIQGADLAALAEAWRAAPDRPVRAATEDGIAGQPVVFPAPLVAQFTDLRGDRGARDLLRAHPPALVPIPGQRAVIDLDTPEDWAAWRARTGIAR